ncbi:MAG: hypothetical protein QF440_02770 [Candidatus Thalassarchaeaceae archaeon]|jgi:hypothetical protein|nr:hypothetical protein [Candidatus Thalassarchaeaceae archaeon]
MNMPGSPYLEERPSGLLTWPLLMPILLTVFLLEGLVGTWVWFTFPSYRIIVYVILGIDLTILIIFFIVTTRQSGENLE